MDWRYSSTAPAAVWLAMAPIVAQAPTREEAAEILAHAQRARTKGDQAAYVACGYRLRRLAPEDPAGHLVLAIGHASLGPRFVRDVARHALARVLRALERPLEVTVVARLAACAGAPNETDPQALRARLERWFDQLEDGEPLLLAPDHDTLRRICKRLDLRLERVSDLASAERARAERLRKRQLDAERWLRRERTRPMRAGEGMIDLQPYVDRIAACRRDLASSDRRRRALDDERHVLQERLKPLSRRLADLESDRGS
ncbi:MAG: hypothetical protein R3F56_05220 [Planctomycetota bacterium]